MDKTPAKFLTKKAFQLWVRLSSQWSYFYSNFFVTVSVCSFLKFHDCVNITRKSMKNDAWSVCVCSFANFELFSICFPSIMRKIISCVASEADTTEAIHQAFMLLRLYQECKKSLKPVFPPSNIHHIINWSLSLNARGLLFELLKNIDRDYCRW